LIPDDLPYIEYDPDLAVELLAEAGWTDTNGDGTVDKDGVELANLRFVTTENTLRNNYQLVIQEALAAIGIGTEIQIIPATTLFASFADRGTLTTFAFDLAIFANSANAFSPIDTDSYTCGGIPSAENPDGFNGWQFCNERYDELQGLLSTTFPGPERDAMWDEAVRLFHEGYFWHGLRVRSTWFAVDTTAVDPASVGANVGSLDSNWMNQVELWLPAS
jgi:peptide/nickel transport system substrate-binding protein